MIHNFSKKEKLLISEKIEDNLKTESERME